MYQLNDVILISKAPGQKKNAFRLIDSFSVPDFLREYVQIDGDIATITSLEGKETLKLSERPVIAYEKLDPERVANVGKLKKNSLGEYWNLWYKANADETLEEINGEFFEKATEKPRIYKAMLVSVMSPAFLGLTEEKAVTTLIPSMEGWTFYVSWQDTPLFATFNKGFWIKYDDDNFNYLEIGTPAADAYFVTDEEGNILMPLSYYYQTLKKEYDL